MSDDRDILALAHAAIEDDKHWPDGPWRPWFDDDGYLIGWTYDGEQGEMDIGFDEDYSDKLGLFIAAARAREPLLAAGVLRLSNMVQAWATSAKESLDQMDVARDESARLLAAANKALIERDALRAEVERWKSAAKSLGRVHQPDDLHTVAAGLAETRAEVERMSGIVDTAYPIVSNSRNWNYIERLRAVAERDASRAEVLRLSALANRLADAAEHCRCCRDCGDGPCCDACDVAASVAELRNKEGT